MSVTLQVVVLFLIALVGLLCRKLRYLTDETVHGITALVLNVSLPCMIVHSMQRPFSREIVSQFILTLLLSMALITVCLFGGFFLFRSRLYAKRSVLANLMAFSNCGFMGYPIIQAVNPSLMIFAVAYNVGYNFISWTFGIALFSGGKKLHLRKALLTPAVIASFIGFAAFCLQITFPVMISETLSLLGGLTTPLTMLLIGTRLYGIHFHDLGDMDYHLIALLRLILIPLAVYLILKPLPFDDSIQSTLFILTAMPCATLVSMQAEMYGGDAVFASRAVAWTTLVSVFSIPLLSRLF